MSQKYVDLHIHSYYSDGTMSPKEILEMAKINNVGLIAITDHDVLEGSRELIKLSKNSDVKCVSGVELDAIYHGLNFHILGYGVDLENEEFQKFVKKDRALLNEVNTKLIEKMEKDYDYVSLEDYHNYTYERNKGGWKAVLAHPGKVIYKDTLDEFIEEVKESY